MRISIQHVQKPEALYRQALLRRWQGWLLGIYIGFFALILPFICWGALADPSHPHTRNHFVFAEPPHVEDQNRVAHIFSRFLAGNPINGNSSLPDQTTAPMSSQATPDTLLITLLSLFIVLLSSFQSTPTQLRLRVFNLPIASEYPLTIPTPPPQFITRSI